jgi:hypothetical protein
MDGDGNEEGRYEEQQLQDEARRIVEQEIDHAGASRAP